MPTTWPVPSPLLSVVSDVFSFADVPAVCCVGATVTVLTVPPAVTVCTMDDGSSVTLAEVASSSSVEVALVSEASVEDSSCPVVELSGVVEVVDVDVDLVDGFTVTVFCTVSVTLDTAMVVDIALVDEGEGPRDPDGSMLPRLIYPYTPEPPQTSLGHAGQGVSHFESLSCTDLTGA
jgi:hypothetical protein